MWGRALAPAGDDRGQTVLDFVVGMSVFLLAVGFTFAFVPSLLEPYTAGEGATLIAAERGAAHLAGTSLAAEGGSTATLSAACTRGFFADADPADRDCGWVDGAGDLHRELGMDEFRGVNVTVTRDGDVVGIDADDAVRTDGSGTRLAAGDAPPPDVSVAVGGRVVDLNGRTYRLTVRVW